MKTKLNETETKVSFLDLNLNLFSKQWVLRRQLVSVLVFLNFISGLKIKQKTKC